MKENQEKDVSIVVLFSTYSLSNAEITDNWCRDRRYE
jgi:hypothetical protein